MAAILVLATLTLAAAQTTPAATTSDSAHGSSGHDSGNAAGNVAASSSGNASADVPPEAAAPLEPAGKVEPHTVMLDPASVAAHDSVLEPKPLPAAPLSLIGGIVRKVDAVHNRVTLQPFGGGDKYVVYLDERSRILNAGREATILEIHPGDRVYVDTQIVGAHVFARTLRVRNSGVAAHASGQIMEVKAGQVSLQDRLSGELIRFLISDHTKVETHGTPSAPSLLQSGSLVDVTFIPGGRRNEAQNITILATPGDSYIFAGLLTHVDLRSGVLALDNQTDGKNYELFFDPGRQGSTAGLTVGTPVAVTASFDGKSYRAIGIKITQP